MATKLKHIFKANVLCQKIWYSFMLNAFIILVSLPTLLKEKYLR